uniref:Uncharacterized protein n=1 Tax=Anopheles funestus TaxID=62324 RepID=A0A182RJW5_ANOFN
MDGLPLHTSGTTCFWPILMKVEIPQATIRPEIAEEYLRPLVNELNHLHRNGITINSVTRPFLLCCIIDDVPARTLIQARTDSMFRMQGYGRHHRELTPLTELDDFDVIKNVVTSDSLHLLDHGAIKKFNALENCKI